MARILWLSHRAPTHLYAGGAERTIRQLTHGLALNGNTVVLVTVSRTATLQRFNLGPVMCVELPSQLHAHLFPILGSVTMRFDFVVDDLAHLVPWATPLVSDVAGVAYFRHLHARTLSGQVSPPLRQILKRVEALYPILYKRWQLVTESQQSVADLHELGFPVERVVRIPPGVDCDLFHPTDQSTSPQLIYFSGLRSYKRPTDAILALHLVRESGIPATLVVMGEGPETKRCREVVSSLGLTSAVRFLGRVGDQELASHVGQSWVHLHCSRAEGWGQSVMEAAACGIPTAAYSVPGVAETVLDGETGYLAVDGSLHGLAEATIRAIQNRRTLSSGCRRWALSHSWSATVSRWNDLVESTIATQG